MSFTCTRQIPHPPRFQSFKVILAPEHMVHSEQILGITGTPRIRFPQVERLY